MNVLFWYFSLHILFNFNCKLVVYRMDIIYIEEDNTIHKKKFNMDYGTNITKTPNKELN